MLPESDLDRLLQYPSETLGVELKPWLTPQTHEEMIAKILLSLYNSDGGILAFGFNDDGTVADKDNPLDPLIEYKPEVIQEIVSKHSTIPFVVRVSFHDLTTFKHPVVTVPSGVVTPALKKGDFGRLQDGDVYVRTLNSNRKPSSSKMRKEDWEPLFKRCFDNREADLGGFVRRQLAGHNNLIEVITKAMSWQSLSPSKLDEAIKLIKSGPEMYKTASSGMPDIFQMGYFAVSAVLDGELANYFVANKEFLHILQRGLPHYGRAFRIYEGSSNGSPYHKDGNWQCDYKGKGNVSPDLEFWRINPQGPIYYIQTLQDDVDGPGGAIDPYLNILRLFDVVDKVMVFSQNMVADLENASVSVAVQWGGLEGRSLHSWSNPFRIRGGGKSHTSQVVESVSIPCSTRKIGLSPYIAKMIAALCVVFDGYHFIDESYVEETIRSYLR